MTTVNEEESSALENASEVATENTVDSVFEEPPVERMVNLPDHDRERLGEAVQKLLSTGSISGVNSASLYHWSRQHLAELKEWAEITGLDVALYHDERLIQAIPHVSSLRLRLRKDETIVWLALWYAGDLRWRDEGHDQAFLSVSELNSLIQDQLLPDVTGQIAQGRLREILRKAAKFNLIRLDFCEAFEDSGIEVLPTIRRAVPFRGLAEWCELAGDFNQQEDEEVEEDEVESDGGEEERESVEASSTIDPKGPNDSNHNNEPS